MNYENFPVLKYTEKDLKFLANLGPKSQFEELLHDLWNRKMMSNYFKYKLGDLKTKYLAGKYKFLSQLNVKRAVERRKPQFISSITMPFNAEIFHFGKVSENEIIFTLKPQHWEKTVTPSNKMENYNHVLIINVSPIEECHSLLVPSIEKCLPQVLNFDGLRLAVETLLISYDKSLKVAFNSLGAYASVNHLHFHLYYLRYNLLLENISVSHLMGHCYELTSFPAEGFAFQIQSASEVVEIVGSVMKLIEYLLKKEIPHNLFMTKGKSFTEDSISENSSCVRIFVWARKAVYGSKNDISFNPAVCELAGHIIVKENDGFETISEEYVSGILKDACHKIFRHNREAVKELYTLD